jgi:hypothetical protein
LSAIVYRPEHLQAVDHHHRQIVEKTCVISALDDNLHTMKAYLVLPLRCMAAYRTGDTRHWKSA